MVCNNYIRNRCGVWNIGLDTYYSHHIEEEFIQAPANIILSLDHTNGQERLLLMGTAYCSSAILSGRLLRRYMGKPLFQLLHTQWCRYTVSIICCCGRGTLGCFVFPMQPRWRLYIQKKHFATARWKNYNCMATAAYWSTTFCISCTVSNNALRICGLCHVYHWGKYVQDKQPCYDW